MKVAIFATIFILVLFFTSIVPKQPIVPQAQESDSKELLVKNDESTDIEIKRVNDAVKVAEAEVKWQDNPSNCDLGPNGTQTVWASEAPEFPCHDKPVVSRAPVAPTGNASADCEQYRGLIAKYFPASQINNAITTMRAESGCRSWVISPTNDYGLFQINGEDVRDPEANIARAWQKYVGGRVGSNNWSAWYAVCSPYAKDGGSFDRPVPLYAGIHCT